MTPSMNYTGKVRHRRFYERTHEFSYHLSLFFFDISAIEDAFKNNKLVSIEKFNWYSYRRKNYLDGAPTPLDRAARELVNEKCHFYPKGKIFLLTNLACLGYCFNPISLYFVFKEDSTKVEALIIEVKNTPWMEKHIYVQNLRENNSNKNIYTCAFRKELHVSPFMSMDYEYKLNFKIDNKQIIVHMENIQNGEKHFDATLSLEKNTAQPMSLLMQYPLMSYKVTAAIYWQALILWLKKVPFHPHPVKK